MNFDRDSREPSIDLVMHACLGIVLIAAVMVFVDWPQLIDAMV